MDTPDTKNPHSPVAVMENNREVAKAVLERLQDDIEKAAKDAGKSPYEVVFCVWTTLGRVLTHDAGIDPGALLMTFIGTHPEVVAGSFEEPSEDKFEGSSIFKTPSSDSIN